MVDTIHARRGFGDGLTQHALTTLFQRSACFRGHKRRFLAQWDGAARHRAAARNGIGDNGDLSARPTTCLSRPETRTYKARSSPA
jgi:hypothetical protein